MAIKIAKFFFMFGIIMFVVTLNACSADGDAPLPPEPERWRPYVPERERRPDLVPLPRVGDRLAFRDGSFTASGTAHGFASFPAEEWWSGYGRSGPGEPITVNVIVEDGWIVNVGITGHDESESFVWHIFRYGPVLVKSMNKFALDNESILRYTDVISRATYSINGINEAGNIALQKIRGEHGSTANVNINTKTLSLEVGEYEILKAAVFPMDLLVTWASSDEDVATVAQTGKVTAVSEGAAVITATISYGGDTFTDSCLLEVLPGSDPGL